MAEEEGAPVSLEISGKEWVDFDIAESFLATLSVAEFIPLEPDSNSKRITLFARSVYEAGDSEDPNAQLEQITETSTVIKLVLGKEPVKMEMKRLYVREMKPQFRVEGSAKVKISGVLTPIELDDNDSDVPGDRDEEEESRAAESQQQNATESADEKAEAKSQSSQPSEE